MKTCGALLALLCCCVAQTQLRAEDTSHNDIKLTPDEVTGAAHVQRTGAALTASTQQTCQPDIHTVLREMNALIVEQRVELRHTKIQLEALEKNKEAVESRLRASEKTVEDQKVELRYTRTQLEALEKNGEAVESRLTTSESLISQLKNENEAQAMDLNLTVTAVLDMRREREQSRVSFSTILLKEGSAEIGPSGVDAPLVFRNVITNIGDSYSAISGVFTAPIRGVYFFVMFMYGHGHSSIASSITLWKNRGQVAIAYAYQQHHSGMSSSNGASLLLEVGDEVYVKLYPGCRVFDNGNHHTTFSGHLLFPM